MKKIFIFLFLFLFTLALPTKIHAQGVGTCKWLPGPPLQAEDSCSQGYAPTSEGNGFTELNCVCKPIGSQNALPSALVATPPPPAVPPPCAEGFNAAKELTTDRKSIIKCTKVSTALRPISVTPEGFVKDVFGILLSLAGGVALLLVMLSGYRLMTSQGNPEKVQAAREQLTSAIVGLLFIIFSLSILQIIGVQILHIPGFQ